ncbi:MAG: FAD-dependent oxidoreductase [Actinobacteria bacterium]|nr:FAD-dependent oxidoreductase [Actinomycetota bacterium]
MMGSAAARALAARGRRVLMLERFEIGHAHGSSHGSGRIFRYSYGDQAYVRMSMEALPLWRALEADTGGPLLRTTGGLDAGIRLDEHEAALRAHGARYERMTASEALERYDVAVDGDALFQPDAGVIDAEDAWRAFVHSAAARGAEVRTSARVEAIERSDARVRVVTRSEPVDASVAVVTAGAWAPGLLASTGIDLDVRPTRETVAYFEVPGQAERPVVVDWGDPAVYALPTSRGVKVGEHQAGPITDPDRPGVPDSGSVARLAGWVAARYRLAAAEARFAETCIYTNTTDSHFVLERHGAIVVGSPCSGHGFKFAPLIGERLADLAEEVI